MTATEATVLARIPDYSCYYWELSFRKKRGDAELTEEVVVPTAGGPTTARLRLPVDLSQGKASLSPLRPRPTIPPAPTA